MNASDLKRIEHKLDLVAAKLDVYKVEEVASVVRRTFTRRDGGGDAEVIDFYPAWNADGTYGEFKLATEYMDHDWQRRRFEHFAGVAVADLPLYESKTALTRTIGRPHACEVEVRPFQLMLQPRPKDDGKHDKTLILRYQPSPQPRQAQPAANGNGRSPAPAVNGNGRPPAQAPVQAPPEPPAPPPANGAGEKDWAADAASSQDALFFDTAMVKVEPWFETAGNVGSFREVIWGKSYVPEHGRGYVAGLAAYAAYRKQANGSKSAHDQAKARAIKAFRQALEID